MDRLDSYRQLIKRHCRDRADLLNAHPIAGIETLCLIDEERDEYLVMNVGWRDRQRVQYITLLVRIRNSKIWIEEDGTEEGLANVLIADGVPKSDIVLAFSPPDLRHLSEFAPA